MEELELQDALIFLAASALVLPLAKLARVSPIIGFLLVGIAVGPFGISQLFEGAWVEYVTMTDMEGVRAFGELGVVFLLFVIGLELSVPRLIAMRKLVFGLGFSQIVVAGLVIGAIAYGWGNTLETAVVLGACLALSSTAVVMQILTEQGRFGSPMGQSGFSILLAQDMAVVPILIVVVTLGGEADQPLIWTLVESIGVAAACVALILGLGRFVVRPLYGFVGESGSSASLMALTLFIIIALGLGSHAVGLSAALGAFLAGLLLGETEFKHEIGVSIDPFKGLLLGLFFISVGMRIDVVAIWGDLFMTGAAIVGLFIVKTPITAVLARLFGHSWPVSWELGLLLGQGGEFAFIVLAIAIAQTLLPFELAQFMITVVAGTLFLTPFVASFARKLGESSEGRAEELPSESPSLSNHVIIVGYGRTGRLLADLLDRQQIAHVALDLDAKRVKEMRDTGAPVYFGDARRTELLHRMCIEDAAAIVVCPDDAHVTEQVTRAVRQVAPHVATVARARDIEHATELMDAGVQYVVPEALEAGLQMGHALLEEIGLPQIAARDVIEMYRLDATEVMEAVETA